MTTGQILAVAAILVPAFAAFLVAYWHRKQLRQIEAYRRDPSVGLTPPPSPLWRFVTSRWKLLVVAGVPALVIALQIYFKAPVTISTVLLVSLNVTTIVVAVLLELIEGIVKVIGKVIELQEKGLGITEKVVAAIHPKGGSASFGA